MQIVPTGKYQDEARFTTQELSLVTQPGFNDLHAPSLNIAIIAEPPSLNVGLLYMKLASLSIITDFFWRFRTDPFHGAVPWHGPFRAGAVLARHGVRHGGVQDGTAW